MIHAGSITCSRCQRSFSSKSSLFQHLRTIDETCLSFEEHALLLQMDLERDGDKMKNTRSLEKIAILFGYINASDPIIEQESPPPWAVIHGDRAAQLVVQAVTHRAKYGRQATKTKLVMKPDTLVGGTPTYRRSNGCVQRHKQLLIQEPGAGAVTEVLSMRAPPLALSSDVNNEGSVVVNQWINDINSILEQLISSHSSHQDQFYGKVQVFGRLTVHPKFDAEADVVHRRVEYLLPVDFLCDATHERNQDTPPYCGVQPPKALFQPLSSQPQDLLRNFFALFPCFSPSQPLWLIDEFYESIPTPLYPLDSKDSKKNAMVRYFYQLKKIMQSMTTSLVQQSADQTTKLEEEEDIDETMDNDIGSEHINVNLMDSDELQGTSNNSAVLHSSTPPLNDTKAEKKRERKYYHNFTANGMAHEQIVYRKMERFYHRSTIHAPNSLDLFGPIALSLLENHPSSTHEIHNNRPFIVFSLKGDSLLTGQVRGMIGLLIAIARGYISRDIIECMFDPEYSNLVTAPFIPTIGMITGDAMYSYWEGKLGLVLSARSCNKYKGGWGDVSILEKVSKFQDELYQRAIKSWYNKGIHSVDGRLNWERDWIQTYLIPWSKRAQQQLLEYQTWKQTKEEQVKKIGSMTNSSTNVHETSISVLPSISSIDTRTPDLYQMVLYHLRK